jgi:transketolase
MAAILNGLSLHGGLIPFGGTFLVFADYERPALRLAALQKLRVIHEFTHDSFFVGEDGPTHQPVEHIMSLRIIPNFTVFRPADALETAVCFKLAIKNRDIPSALLLSRQGLPVMEKSYSEIEKGVRKGAYTIKVCDEPAEILLIATGSEVALAVEVADLMKDRRVRVVSMPSWELFDSQRADYRARLIPPRGCLKVSIEAGVTLGWERYVGSTGLSIGLDKFGVSAPAEDLARKFGFTAENIVKKINNYLETLL